MTAKVGKTHVLNAEKQNHRKGRPRKIWRFYVEKAREIKWENAIVLAQDEKEWKKKINSNPQSYTLVN